MVLLKPKIDVKIENSITDKNDSILVEAIFDETKYIFEMFMRQTSKHRQIQCLRDLSNNVINNSANKKIILGGDYNCGLCDIDMRGGRPTSHKTLTLH